MPGLKNIQSTYKERKQEIIFNIALEAEKRPLLESGLWFHDDVRNNFYYASYLLQRLLMILLSCLLIVSKRNRKHRMCCWRS